MTKNETLDAWRALTPNQPIAPHFTPIPYKARGSKYGACGIRIDGNPEFIDAVLSRLQDLIALENGTTRLQLSRSVVAGTNLGKDFRNRDAAAECCYIRLHERGRESQIYHAIAGASRERVSAARVSAAVAGDLFGTAQEPSRTETEEDAGNDGIFIDDTGDEILE